MATLIKDHVPQDGPSIYPDIDPIDLDDAGKYYFRHVLCMTKEKLFSKSSIAIQLGDRDRQIDELTEADAQNKRKIAKLESDTEALHLYVRGLEARLTAGDPNWADKTFLYEDK